MRTFIALELPSDFITNIAQIEQDLQSSIQGHFVTENSFTFHSPLWENSKPMLSCQQPRQHSNLQRAISLPYRCILKDWVYLVALLMQHSGWASPHPGTHAFSKNIRTELTIKGLPYDQVQFKPHITLARHAHLTLQQIKDYPMPDTTRATNVTIFRSDLLPNGAQYTPLHSVTL